MEPCIDSYQACGRLHWCFDKGHPSQICADNCVLEAYSPCERAAQWHPDVPRTLGAVLLVVLVTSWSALATDLTTNQPRRWCDKITGQTLPVSRDFTAYTLREPMGVAGQIIPWVRLPPCQRWLGGAAAG
jgi:hypothetical protein